MLILFACFSFSVFSYCSGPTLAMSPFFESAPQSIFPLFKKHIPPNMFFSVNAGLSCRMSLMRFFSFSSCAIF